MTRFTVAYSCHDAFPSAAANTQQIFWTTQEVARRDAAIDLFVPASGTMRASHPGEAREHVANYYGLAPSALAPSLVIHPVRSSGAADRGTMANAGWMTHGRFDWRLPRRLRTARYDLIWTRDPFAAAVSVRAGLPTIFETYRADLATRARFALWRAATLPGRSLAGVIVHSRLARDAYVHAGVPADRCLVAYNGFVSDHAHPPLSRADARQRLGLPADVPLVVYTGACGRRKGVDAIVRLAARVPSARFVIVGVNAGSDEDRDLTRAASEQAASNLVLRDRVSSREVWPYLFAADCLLVPPTSAPQRQHRRTGLPIKLFGYLAAGRPILAPRLEDIEEVLTDGVTARLVPPDDTDAAAAALIALLGDDSLRARLGRAAQDASAAFTWSARGRLVSDFLQSVVAARHGTSAAHDARASAMAATESSRR
jgi:glycosyltransferase involved in cell wall biosynthesis